MATSEAQLRATKKYLKEKVKTFSVAFYPADMELYTYLYEQPNKAGFIKDLIREHMEKHAN